MLCLKIVQRDQLSNANGGGGLCRPSGESLGANLGSLFTARTLARRLRENVSEADSQEMSRVRIHKEIKNNCEGVVIFFFCAKVCEYLRCDVSCCGRG